MFCTLILYQETSKLQYTVFYTIATVFRLSFSLSQHCCDIRKFSHHNFSRFSGKPRYFIDKFQCNNNTSIFTVFCLSQYQGIAIFQYIGLGTHITHSIKFILRSLMMNVLGNEIRQLAVKTPTYTENAGILGENLFPLLSWLISLSHSHLYRDYLEQIFVNILHFANYIYIPVIMYLQILVVKKVTLKLLIFFPDFIRYL